MTCPCSLYFDVIPMRPYLIHLYDEITTLTSLGAVVVVKWDVGKYIGRIMVLILITAK